MRRDEQGLTFHTNCLGQSPRKGIRADTRPLQRHDEPGWESIKKIVLQLDDVRKDLPLGDVRICVNVELRHGGYQTRYSSPNTPNSSTIRFCSAIHSPYFSLNSFLR